MGLGKYIELTKIIGQIEQEIYPERAEEFRQFVSKNQSLTNNVSAMDCLRVISELVNEGKIAEAAAIIETVGRTDYLFGKALKQATFEYLKNGHEIFRMAEKDWPAMYSDADIARKEFENSRLEKTLPDIEAKEMMLEGLRATETPLPVRAVRILHPSAVEYTVLHKEEENNFYITKDDKGWWLRGPGKDSGITTKIDPEKLDMNDLMRLSERYMKEKMQTSPELVGVRDNEPSHDSKDNAKWLQTYIYIARKYQGIARERDLNPPLPPNDKNQLQPDINYNIYQDNELKKQQENQIPKMPPDIIYEPAPGMPDLPNKYPNEVRTDFLEELPHKKITEVEFDTPYEIPFVDDIEEIPDANEADKKEAEKQQRELDEGMSL